VKRRGRNAVKDREAREICVARKTAGRGNLSGRTVAAKKPEVARNEVPRRRAFARIHDKYTAAVGVILYRRTHGPSTVSVATALRYCCRRRPGQRRPRNETRKNDPTVSALASGSALAAWKEMRTGTLCEPPSSWWTVSPLHSEGVARYSSAAHGLASRTPPFGGARFSSFQCIGAPGPLSRCATPLVPAARPPA
jgi:hypothetical protein